MFTAYGSEGYFQGAFSVRRQNNIKVRQKEVQKDIHLLLGYKTIKYFWYQVFDDFPVLLHNIRPGYLKTL